jgi:hypothetical protein
MLTGRVVDNQGRPIPGVALAVLTEGATQWARQRMPNLPLPPGSTPTELWDQSVDIITDADGFFRATGVLPGVTGELVGTRQTSEPPTRLHPPLANPHASFWRNPRPRRLDAACG